MNPEKQHIANLAAKWESGNINPEEELELNRWYQTLRDADIHIPVEFAVSESEHEHRLWLSIQQNIGDQMQLRRLRTRRVFMKVAAAVALVVFGLAFFTSKYKAGHADRLEEAAKDIKPGKFGATLTLADGRIIKLDSAANGVIARESGISIVKSADGQVNYIISGEQKRKMANTLSTSRGETYKITLPDGSKIWLNAASSLTYNAALVDSGLRKVRMEGEAYFEIAKDETHPFIVESGNQKIQVMGTHFNVNAYEDELTLRTTLIEGSVQVSQRASSEILKPGEQAVNRNGSIVVQKADPELAVAWKNHKFTFERLSVQEIMKMIERWYDVNIIYEGEIPKVKFLGSVSRFENVSKVLKALESTGNVHFEIKGKTIYVSKP